MTQPEQDRPAPRHIPGFNTKVTLSTGIEVWVRKIDVEVIATNAVSYVLNAYQLKEVAQDHLKGAAEAVSELDKTPKRPQDDPVFQAETTALVMKRIVQTGVQHPYIEELVEMYGGRPDLSEVDLGLGPDFSVLLKAITALNDGGEAAKEEAAAFPVPPRDEHRRASTAVRKATQRGGANKG